MNDLRSTRRHKELRRRFREECEAEDRRCWLCGLPIAYGMPGNHDSFELDHYFVVSRHPQFVDDPANFRASHSRCNRVRGDGNGPVSLGSLSRAW